METTVYRFTTEQRSHGFENSIDVSVYAPEGRGTFQVVSIQMAGHTILLDNGTAMDIARKIAVLTDGQW
jgi:hypothetical protein